MKTEKVYEKFSETFRTIERRHAALKTEPFRRNDAVFIAKELRKVIIHRSIPKRKN